GFAEELLDGCEYGADVERWLPSTLGRHLEHVEADAAGAVDVGVVHRRDEAHRRRLEWVPARHRQVQAEGAVSVGRAGRPGELCAQGDGHSGRVEQDVSGTECMEAARGGLTGDEGVVAVLVRPAADTVGRLALQQRQLALQPPEPRAVHRRATYAPRF